jgi:hypothetical protein
MFCPSSKHENRAGRKFCVYCRGGLEASAVPRAVRAPSHGEQFCGQCGKPLAGRSTAAAPPDPRSYTSEAHRRYDPPTEGERKQVTALFADVKVARASDYPRVSRA